MNMERFPDSEFYADETLAIATAITERGVRSSEELAHIMTWLSGRPIVKASDEARRISEINQTVLLLKQVEEPSFVVSVADNVALSMSDEEADELAAGYELAQYGVSGAETREMIGGLAGQVCEQTGYTDDDHARDFAAQLTAAKEVAAENHVGVAEVYERDELFYEASRRTKTPLEYARFHMTLMTSFTGEILQNGLIGILEEPLRKEFADLPSDVVESHILGLQLDEEFTAMITSTISVARETIRQLFMLAGLRRWGSEVLELLETDELAELKPKSQLVPLVQAAFDQLDTPS